MNNYLIYNDPLLGNFYISDLINYINIIKNNNDIMIKRLYTILSNLDYDDEDISTILREDVSSSLEFIANLLSNNI